MIKHLLDNPAYALGSVNCDEADLKPVDTVGLVHSLLLDMLNIMKLNAKSRNKWLRIQVNSDLRI